MTTEKITLKVVSHRSYRSAFKKAKAIAEAPPKRHVRKQYEVFCIELLKGLEKHAREHEFSMGELVGKSCVYTRIGHFGTKKWPDDREIAFCPVTEVGWDENFWGRSFVIKKCTDKSMVFDTRDFITFKDVLEYGRPFYVLYR